MTYEELEKLNIDFSDCKIDSAAPGPSGKQKKSSDQGKKILNQEQKPKSKAGRKNRGLTKQHYEEYKERQRQTYDMFMHTKSPDNFNNDLVEHVTGEIINADSIEDFKELYQLTCDTILERFKENNPELIKKHPYNWYKPLLIEIKKNVPRITADDIKKCFVVWDCLSDLLFTIGLYPTFELFQYMTNIYRYQLENRRGLSPAYDDLLKKIVNDSECALISELATSPYNSTNKIFLAKVHGIIEKTEPKQIEVTHNIQSFDNIARYRLQDQEKSD